MEKFKKGCKRLFLGNIISVIALAVMLVVAAVIVLVPDISASLAFLLLLCPIAILVAGVICFVGLWNVKDTNKLTKIAVVSFIVYYAVNFFTSINSNEILGLIATFLNIAVYVLLILGIAKAEPNVSKLAKIVLILFVCGNGLSLVFSALTTFGVVTFTWMGTITTALEIAASVGLIVLFKKASK